MIASTSEIQDTYNIDHYTYYLQEYQNCHIMHGHLAEVGLCASL